MMQLLMIGEDLNSHHTPDPPTIPVFADIVQLRSLGAARDPLHLTPPRPFPVITQLVSVGEDLLHWTPVDRFPEIVQLVRIGESTRLFSTVTPLPELPVIVQLASVATEPAAQRIPSPAFPEIVERRISGASPAPRMIPPQRPAVTVKSERTAPVRRP